MNGLAAGGWLDIHALDRKITAYSGNDRRKPHFDVWPCQRFLYEFRPGAEMLTPVNECDAGGTLA